MMRRFGAAAIIDDRLPGFLKWQSIQSIPVYFLGKTLVSPSTTLVAAVYEFIFFQLSLVVFSTSLFLASSPEPVSGVSPIELLSCLHKLIILVLYGGQQPLASEFEGRAKVILSLVIFVACSGVCACMAVVCLYGSVLFGELGLRGFIIGLVYGLSCKIWVYDFQMIQRAPFHGYKLVVGKAFIGAVKLAASIGIGGVFVFVLPITISGQLATIEHTSVFCFASFVVFLCWELNRNLLQVIMTKRLVFAPTTAAEEEEKKASDYLIEALEESSSKPLVGYLAYLDLCMVCESNFETWRRAALFEASGETYKKVIALCLNPLQQLTLDLTHSSSTTHEPFYQLQVCMWGARTASSLIVGSKKEDGLPFGVARGSYAAVLSTLLSCLLAVEAAIFMKKSTNPPTRISKAYSMAGILRTSIYQIVWNFHQELVISCSHGLLQHDWIASNPNPPLYGSPELLGHKLHMFLEFQAN